MLGYETKAAKVQVYTAVFIIVAGMLSMVGMVVVSVFLEPPITAYEKYEQRVIELEQRVDELQQQSE